MNSLQWLIATAPVILLYPVLIFTLESEGTINRRNNILTGLILAPVVAILMPFLAIQIIGELARKRRFANACLIALVLITLVTGYGFGIYAARDRFPDPSVIDVEQ